MGRSPALPHQVEAELVSTVQSAAAGGFDVCRKGLLVKTGVILLFLLQQLCLTIYCSSLPFWFLPLLSFCLPILGISYFVLNFICCF